MTACGFRGGYVLEHFLGKQLEEVSVCSFLKSCCNNEAARFGKTKVLMSGNQRCSWTLH